MSIELAWCVISVLGILVAVWGFLDASADLDALKQPTNGRLIIAGLKNLYSIAAK